MICFLVLMENGKGLSEKSPDYITEKAHMLRSGLNAFAHLDIYNMRKVVAWSEKWGVQLDTKIIEEMSRQNHAAAELEEKGFVL